MKRHYQNVIIEKIIISADKGAAISDCIREAIIIAAEEWVNIELIHNSNKYVLNVNNLIPLMEKVP